MPFVRSLQPGQIVGGYELLQSLAEGAMATTWQARSVEGAGMVALKTIALANIDDPDLEDALLDEAARAQRLVHPQIARLLACGRDGSSLYAAFAWTQGKPLAALFRTLASEPLPLGVALRLVVSLCSAVAAVHEAGLLHGAISPSNFLLSPDGGAHLLDLGVSVHLSRSSSTTFRHMVGKFSYLSPEHLWSRPLSARSDVFCLGLLAYELLTGQHPFRGRHERETTANILSPSAAPPPTGLPTRWRLPARRPGQGPGRALRLRRRVHAGAAGRPRRQPPYGLERRGRAAADQAARARDEPSGARPGARPAAGELGPPVAPARRDRRRARRRPVGEAARALGGAARGLRAAPLHRRALVRLAAVRRRQPRASSERWWRASSE